MSTKVRTWHKVTAEMVGLRENARVKPSAHLEVRTGIRKISFRVNYRQHGIKLRQVIDEDLDLEDWQRASKLAEEMIYKARFGDGPKDKDLTRSEDLCDEIVKLKESKSRATYEQTEIFFRKHIKPYLNDHCPYAADLNATVWLNYKNHIRLQNPKVTLFNHWKFFTMLFKYAHEKGILKAPIKLSYDEEKEDFRATGMVIPDEHLKKMIANANTTWRDRMILQRFTGQRPGVIRKLRKDQVNLETGHATVQKEDSKNRRKYSFYMPGPCLEILRRRAAGDSPYFFPSLKTPTQPMDKHLTGWYGALERAGIREEYTPHDLRHTFLTEKFKKTDNPALVCYQCDLSLEEAMETYIHFDAEDTRVIAEDSSRRALELLT
jgi:integrase